MRFGALYFYAFVAFAASEKGNDTIEVSKSFEDNPKALARIVGGYQVNIHRIPYQVSVQFRYRHICGGIKIRPAFILTAASCFEGYYKRLKKVNPGDFAVRAGSSYWHSGGEIITVKQIYRHHQFVRGNRAYDAAVLELVKRFRLNLSSFPVILNMIHPPETISVLVSGWGYREKSGFTTSAVRASSVKVYTKKIYWNNTETNQLVSGDMLRDSIFKGRKGVCVGDKGGPAAIRLKLMGIISEDTSCGNSTIPGLYTRVDLVRSWILCVIRSTKNLNSLVANFCENIDE